MQSTTSNIERKRRVRKFREDGKGVDRKRKRNSHERKARRTFKMSMATVEV